MEFTGKVKKVGETEQVSDKFKKRELIVTIEGQYPQHISVQATQDKCVIFDKLAIGTDVKVHFNLRGREWTSPINEVKYFNTIECWRLEVLAESKGVVMDDLPF